MPPLSKLVSRLQLRLELGQHQTTAPENDASSNQKTDNDQTSRLCVRHTDCLGKLDSSRRISSGINL